MLSFPSVSDSEVVLEILVFVPFSSFIFILGAAIKLLIVFLISFLIGALILIINVTVCYSPVGIFIKCMLLFILFHVDNICLRKYVHGVRELWSELNEELRSKI